MASYCSAVSNKVRSELFNVNVQERISCIKILHKLFLPNAVIL